MKVKFKYLRFLVLIIGLIINSVFLFSITKTDTSNVKKKNSEIIIKESNQNHEQNKYVELKKDIDEILNNKEIFNANYGIYITNLDSNEVIYKYNEFKNFIPASTNKIIVTSTALDLLGPNFRFSTSIYLDGKVNSSGEYEGNIYLRGTGDPTLSTNFEENPLSVLEEFVLALDSLGITSIKGNIIADDRYFDKQYYAKGWMWDDFSYYYSAQVSALSIYDNKVDVSIKSSKSININPKITYFPNTKYIKFQNNLKSGDYNSATNIIPLRDFNSNEVSLQGNVAIDTSGIDEFNIAVTINNPSQYFLQLFKMALDYYNISHKGALLDIEDFNKEFRYADLKLLKERYSPELYNIISNINKISNNLASDILLKTISKEVTGTGSFNNGIIEVKSYLKRKGIDNEVISYNDGSGLSRYNLISPIIQSSILKSIYKSKNKELFISTLAQPGKTGTLKNRLTSTKAEKAVFAKTGTMSSVSNICGFVKNEDGEFLSFSLMFNGFTCPLSTVHTIQDLILMRLSALKRKS